MAAELTFGLLSAAFNIKPVSIVCEFFAVFQGGHHSKWLALARFSQEQGAKTSFSRFVTTMEDVMTSRALLVRNKQKARFLRKVLKEHVKALESKAT